MAVTVSLCPWAPCPVSGPACCYKRPHTHVPLHQSKAQVVLTAEWVWKLHESMQVLEPCAADLAANFLSQEKCS